MLNRRKLITGLISFVAAPAIVRASSLMPVKVMDSFDPKEVYNQLMSKMIIDYSPTPGEFYNGIRLYWLTHQGFKIIPIEQSNAYLESLND